MSRAELATGKDREMRQLAKEIVSAQEKEIALIDRWLKKYEKIKRPLGKKVNLKARPAVVPLIEARCKNSVTEVNQEINRTSGAR